MASTTSLANKYRPSTFDQLVEQSHIVDVLKAQLLNGHSHSNYIFFGPRGTGKTTTARIFAKALNCPHNAKHAGNPCGECESCLMISANKAVDIVEIDAASYTGVDNIRDEIISKASYPPAALKRKVYIIDEVHMLSKGAFNALLKIMEEPPVYLTFILATTEIHKVPETIISRCQLFQFRKLSYDAIVTQLEKICNTE
jgi:DNA polymerase-3 subunit gamma/tau